MLGNLNEAKTLGTDLNVFETFEPKIPASYRDSEYLFLANIDPVLQARVRSQMPKVRMVCGDTMNYWIADHTENLKKVLRELDVLLINDGEVKMLSGETNLLLGAKKVLAMGPKTLVVKHGEYGATAFFQRSYVPGCYVDHIAVSRASAAAGRGGGSDGCGRFVRGRVLWLYCVAAEADAGGVSHGDVLWRRVGIVCCGAVWDGALAGSVARGDRRAVPALPGDIAS